MVTSLFTRFERSVGAIPYFVAGTNLNDVEGNVDLVVNINGNFNRFVVVETWDNVRERSVALFAKIDMSVFDASDKPVREGELDTNAYRPAHMRVTLVQ